MKRLKIIMISKRVIYLTASIAFIIFLLSISLHFVLSNQPANYLSTPKVETAFISNDIERQLLTTEDFREELAKAISNGVDKYLTESNKVYVPQG